MATDGTGGRTRGGDGCGGDGSGGTGRGGAAGSAAPGFTALGAVRAEAVVRTPRLDLLPLREEYAGEMAGVLSDPALHAFTGGRPDTPEELRARYRRLAAGAPEPGVWWGNWVVRLREESRLAGTVQATVRSRAAGPEAELAWVVGAPWQGRGIAKEAAAALAGRLERAGVRTLVAHVHPDHRASAAVAAACGLAPTERRYEGEVRWERDAAAGGGGAAGGRSGGTAGP